MGPRARIFLIVGAAAAAAAVATVGATLLTTEGESEGTPGPPAVTKPREGAPPLVLDLGLRTDAEAVALRRAERLYDRDRRTEAGRIFARYGSLPARIGASFAAWPHGSLERLEALARAHPGSALVRLHLGLARFWAGRDAQAVAAWRETERVDPDSLSAVRAGDLLHPEYARGLPVFVPSFSPPAGLAQLPPARQLASLAQAARTGGVREKLLYGIALQRIGRPLSARRQYAAAARLAPGNVEAQVAAAVGRFDKERPERAFSRLGPLTGRFPRAPTVRFHLGLLLLWIGRVEEAERQLARARAQAPSSPLGREANRFLLRLENIRTE